MDIHSLPSYPGPLVLRTGFNRRLGLTVAGCILLAILAWWSCVHAYDGDTPFHQPPALLRAVCGVGVVFFGLGAVFLLWQMLSRRTALLLDADGLEWQPAGLGAPGRVPWAQVTGVEVYEQQVNVPSLYAQGRGQIPWVRVFVQDPEALIAQSSGRIQRILRSSNRMAQPPTPVWISCQSLSLGPADVASLVDEYLRAHRASHTASEPGAGR